MLIHASLRAITGEGSSAKGRTVRCSDARCLPSRRPLTGLGRGEGERRDGALDASGGALPRRAHGDQRVTAARRAWIESRQNGSGAVTKVKMAPPLENQNENRERDKLLEVLVPVIVSCIMVSTVFCR